MGAVIRVGEFFPDTALLMEVHPLSAIYRSKSTTGSILLPHEWEVNEIAGKVSGFHHPGEVKEEA
jgi:hypothetical protein